MRFLFLAFACLLLSPQLDANASDTQIQIIPNTLIQTTVPQEQIAADIRANFNVDSYRSIRVRIVTDKSNSPDHLVLSLFIKGFHKLELASVKLGKNFQFSKITMDYRLQPDDEQQAHLTRAASCPDSSVQFIAFAPNNDALEQQVTEEVAQTAVAAHLKTVRLLKANATKQNYMNYMSCPNLKGNFYDGDANPDVIATVDGELTSSELSSLNFNHHVTNIWLACEAFNDPIMSVMVRTTQSQKYAAGINDLAVGPSDKAAACAMEGAIRGNSIKASFDSCYARLDTPADHWGFAGDGSDYFGR